MVRLDFFTSLVFAEASVYSLTLLMKGVRITVDSVKQVFFSWNASASFIKDRLAGEFIMLSGQIVNSSTVVGILERNVFNYCHDIHLLICLMHLAFHRAQKCSRQSDLEPADLLLLPGSGVWPADSGCPRSDRGC